MGIGIRNNSSGNRVTIDGEKVIEKINFLRREFTTEEYLYNGEYDIYLKKPPEIFNFETDTFYMLIFEKGIGWSKTYEKIYQFIPETGKLEERTLSDNFNYDYPVAGYEDNIYKMLSNKMYEYKLKDKKISNLPYEADGLVTKTQITTATFYANMQSTVYDRKNKCFYGANKQYIYELDKEKNQVTTISNNFVDKDIVENYNAFYKNNCLYFHVGEGGYNGNSNYTHFSLDCIYKYDLDTNKSTKLFYLIDKLKFESETINNITYQRMYMNHKGEIVFIYTVNSSLGNELRKCIWDIEKNEFKIEKLQNVGNYFKNYSEVTFEDLNISFYCNDYDLKRYVKPTLYIREKTE